MSTTRMPLPFVLALTLGACSRPAAPAVDAKVDGPASIVTPEVSYATDGPTIAKGQELFASKGCAACHKLGGGKLVGPDLEGVTARRSAKWIAKMILKPEVMLREDDQARDLLKAFMTPMANQNIDAATELAPLLAYLKAHETK